MMVTLRGPHQVSCWGSRTWSAARVKALVADFAGLDLLVAAGHAALGDARGVGATRPPPRRGRAHAQAADLHPQAFRALTRSPRACVARSAGRRPIPPALRRSTTGRRFRACASASVVHAS